MNKGYYNVGTRFILLCDKIYLRLLPNENVSRELLETENYLEILENQIAQLEEEKFEMELNIDSLNFTFFLSLACGLLSTGDMIINISNAVSNPSLKVFIAYLIKCAVVYSSCKLAIFSAKKRKEILTDLKIFFNMIPCVMLHLGKTSKNSRDAPLIKVYPSLMNIYNDITIF